MKDIASKTFILQQDQSDCGVACLSSIVRFHGGENSLDHLRKISGTSKQGTTLLGLLQAAKQIGFDAEGLEAENIFNLAELDQPCIIHVVIDNTLQHYMVYYPQSNQEKGGNVLSFGSKVTLGDPAKGIVEMSLTALDQIWQSKALLKLTTNTSFPKKSDQKRKRQQWIIDLIKDDINILLISLFLGLAISVLGISTAIFSQKLIDDFLPKENVQKLWLSLVLVMLLLFIRSGLSYVRNLFMIRQGMDFNNRIIKSFYGNLLGLHKSFFDTRKIGDLIARMNDTRRIQSVLSVVSGSIVIDALVILISLGFIFSYSNTTGFIMLASLPVYFLILIRFNWPIINMQKGVMSAYAMAESNFIDTMQGVADIKLMNKQSFFEKTNSFVYGEFQNRMATLGKLNSKLSLMSELTGVVFMITVFGTASWLVLAKELKLGEMVALLGMAGSVVPSVNRLVISNIQIQEALVAFDRMFEFTSTEKETEGGSTKGILVDKVMVKDISFRFPGRKQILKNISLQINKGEMVALLGESGGGKSTLLQLIQKFYQPENGIIQIGENELQNINTFLWREQISVVPQELKIFNGNLLYNITLSDHPEDYQKAIEFCEGKGFGKFFRELTQGYLTLLGEEGINISGGQKQLVILARALFRQPQLLLLDESTSAMDRRTEDFVLSILEKEKEKMIILMVTHRIKTAKRCDRIYILENGIIATSGTSNELMLTNNLFSESYREWDVQGIQNRIL